MLVPQLEHQLSNGSTADAQLYPSHYTGVWNITEAKAKKRINELADEVKNQSLCNHLAQGFVSPSMSWDDSNFNRGI